MKNILFEAKYFAVKSIRFIFSVINGGQNCVICDAATSLIPLCRKCINQYFSVSNALSIKRCEKCGKELISTNTTCMQCREKIVLNNIDYMLPLFSYRLWNKELMFIWKQKENRSLSEVFARIIHKALEKDNIKNIVPVPPRKGKIQEKGWDQIDDLCSFLEKRYGYKVLNILQRSSIIQQKKLHRNQRLETIGNSYSLIENFNSVFAEGVLPEEVCIIDDVMTTGSTLESCSQILKKAGVKRIKAITLFIVD